jgi:hypothetical protein
MPCRSAACPSATDDQTAHAGELAGAAGQPAPRASQTGSPWWPLQGVEADDRAGQHGQGIEAFTGALVADPPQPPPSGQPGAGALDGPAVALTPVRLRGPVHPAPPASVVRIAVGVIVAVRVGVATSAGATGPAALPAVGACKPLLSADRSAREDPAGRVVLAGVDGAWVGLTTTAPPAGVAGLAALPHREDPDDRQHCDDQRYCYQPHPVPGASVPTPPQSRPT